MRKRSLGVGIVVIALFVAGVWSGIGSARMGSSTEAVALKATLAAGAEVPRPTGAKPGAGGSFAAGLTRKASGGTLAWRLTFHGLTGASIAAHVHTGKPGKAGPIAVALCGPCRSGQRGSAKVNARTVSALMTGGAYVNVHTTKNPGGEIRGQVKKGGTAVAPPTTTTTSPTTTTTTTPYPPYP
jgi:CHRD domain